LIFILLAFYQTVFRQDDDRRRLAAGDYLFFRRCYLTLEGLIETLFLENCNGFADLVRSATSTSFC